MNKIVFGLLVIAVITLSGCAEKGGGNSVVKEPSTDFEDSADTFSRLTTDMFAGDLVEIRHAELPSSGTASFSGPIEIAEYTGTSAVGYLLYGTLNLDVDFGVGIIEGDAVNFIAVDIDYDSGEVSIEDVSGTLDISGGKIASYVYDTFDNACMTGTLTGSDLGDVEITAVLSGSFYYYGGNNPDVVIGHGEGASEAGSGITDLYILFFAE